MHRVQGAFACIQSILVWRRVMDPGAGTTNRSYVRVAVSAVHPQCNGPWPVGRPVDDGARLHAEDEVACHF